MLNNLQKIASSISGYEHYEDFTSARNDFYYDECDSLDKKISQVLAIGENFGDDDCIILTKDEARKIVEFLDIDFSGSNEMYHAYENLK